MEIGNKKTDCISGILFGFIAELSLSFIYTWSHPQVLSTNPLAFERATHLLESISSIFSLSSHKVYPQRMLPYVGVSSYLTFSPLSCKSRTVIFCGTCCEQRLYAFCPLPVRKYGALWCPDFPLSHPKVQQRQTQSVFNGQK